MVKSGPPRVVSNSRSKTDCLQSVRNSPKFVRLKVEGPSGRVYATTNVLFGLVTSTIHFRRPSTFQRTGIFTILESRIWTWTRTIIIFSYNNSQKSKSEKITSSNHSKILKSWKRMWTWVHVFSQMADTDVDKLRTHVSIELWFVAMVCGCTILLCLWMS